MNFHEEWLMCVAETVVHHRPMCGTPAVLEGEDLEEGIGKGGSSREM